MAHTVFYAWQSDLSQETNKQFIDRALVQAIKAARKDGVSIDRRPDQDARG
jgi:hypothetical protein